MDFCLVFVLPDPLTIHMLNGLIKWGFELVNLLWMFTLNMRFYKFSFVRTISINVGGWRWCGEQSREDMFRNTTRLAASTSWYQWLLFVVHSCTLSKASRHLAWQVLKLGVNSSKATYMMLKKTCLEVNCIRSSVNRSIIKSENISTIPLTVAQFNGTLFEKIVEINACQSKILFGFIQTLEEFRFSFTSSRLLSVSFVISFLEK